MSVPADVLAYPVLWEGMAMRRREFIAALGGAAVWPVVTRAQQPAPIVGFLGTEAAGVAADRVRAFLLGLNEIGFVERRMWRSNIAGRMIKMSGCLRWRLIWFLDRSR